MRPRAGAFERPGAATPGQLWAVILAGGDGLRLRSLARHLSGEERPKQYVALLGVRTLLDQTLDRVALLIPPERTVIVETRPHARYRSASIGAGPAPHVLVQPENRGTAVGVLYPVHWIARRDPDAVVVVFPSDHFVLEEQVFVAHVATVATVAHRYPERLILLGARSTGPETDYGWIDPGASLDDAREGPVFGVRQFREKPTLEEARAYHDAGWLWNTFILVGRASAFVEAGRETVPGLHESLAHLGSLVDAVDESRALDEVYASAQTTSFSHSVVGASVARLAVSPLPAVLWSDWGCPERVIETLGQAGLTVPWLSEWATRDPAASRPAR